MSKKFEVGKTYATRSICDHNCVFSYKVLARTQSTIKIKDVLGVVKSRRVALDYHGDEMVHPEGRYSMAPMITARDAA